MDYTHTTKPDQTSALYLHQQLDCKNKRHSVRHSKNRITYYSFLIFKKFIFSTPTTIWFESFFDSSKSLNETKYKQKEQKPKQFFKERMVLPGSAFMSNSWEWNNLFEKRRVGKRCRLTRELQLFLWFSRQTCMHFIRHISPSFLVMFKLISHFLLF